ncbi:hypothetical protein ACSC9T_09725 [Pseudomonas putida]|uniref:hypothetical protein n=1 Tax=Pseudomonas putida TaxID=303 RepID=UPI003F4AC354
MKLRCFTACALLLTVGAAGAKEIPQDVSVQAVVSTPEFQVTSVDNWWDDELRAEYDPSRLVFKQIKKDVFVKSTYGPIYAKTDSPFYRFKRVGGAEFQRRYYISLNRLVMGTTPVEIVSAAEAAEGKTIEFRFYPMPEASTVRMPGTYITHATVMFETGAP